MTVRKLCVVYSSFYCALITDVSFCVQQSPVLKNVSDWTWLHAIQYNPSQRLKNQNKVALFFQKEEVQPFSQLILSWNAFRPKKGFFTFDVRVRDKGSKAWSGWKKMHEWGSEMQKSFYGPSDGIAHVQYVRLEMEKYRSADAFDVRIKAHKGASLQSITSCYVCTSTLSAFVSESIDYYQTLDSVQIEGLPHYSQFLLEHAENNRICSPTSCSMVLGFLLKNKIAPLDFANAVYDEGLDTYGNWSYNMAQAYHVAEGKYKWYVTRLHSFWYLHQQLLKKLPIVVSVRGMLQGAPKEYMNGHLLVVVGFDDKTKTVLCHDPAVISQEFVLQKYPLESFLRAWERSHRLAYIVDYGK